MGPLNTKKNGLVSPRTLASYPSEEPEEQPLYGARHTILDYDDRTLNHTFHRLFTISWRCRLLRRNGLLSLKVAHAIIEYSSEQWNKTAISNLSKLYMESLSTRCFVEATKENTELLTRHCEILIMNVFNKRKTLSAEDNRLIALTDRFLVYYKVLTDRLRMTPRPKSRESAKSHSIASFKYCENCRRYWAFHVGNKECWTADWHQI